MRRVLIFLQCGALTVAGLLAAAWMLRRSADERSAVADVANELQATLPHTRSDGTFVTSQGCRECHPEQYTSWHASFHRTMTQRATPQTVLADFEETTLELRGEGFQLSRDKDEFWVEISRAAGATNAEETQKTQPVERTKSRIVMTTGSHHFQLYWRATGEGNMLESLPFVYLVTDKRLVPIEDAVLAPASPNGDSKWNETCIHCHSVGPIPNVNFAATSAESLVAELGISCERCHGAGDEHARRHRAAALPESRTSDQPDPSIVLPSRLDHRASAQVCGQCHSLIDWKDDWEQFRQTGYRYKPGEELTLDRHIIRPTARTPDEATRANQARFFEDQLGGERAEFWDDCTPRISGREYNSLLESACYLRGTLTCISCHSLHQSDPNGQLTAEMRGNQACFQCHAEYREKITEHTHHPAESSGSLCYNCHMPNTTYGLLTFTRSHRIDSPSAARANPERPNACVLCHLDQTRSWAASYLSQWYGQSAPTLVDEDDVAAGAVHTLRGDCCQRALIAWHARWEPARAASGSAWLTPLLTQLLNDPYAAVRYQAGLSLKTLPGFEKFVYDYVAPESVRALRQQQAVDLWDRESTTLADRRDPRVLLDANGKILRARTQQLLERRDNRPMRCVN